MDAATADAIRTVVADLLTEAGDSVAFTHASRTLRGVRSTLKAERVNTDAGLAGKYEFSILAPAAQFVSTPPKDKDRIATGGKTYKALSVELDSIGSAYRIHLGPEVTR